MSKAIEAIAKVIEEWLYPSVVEEKIAAEAWAAGVAAVIAHEPCGGTGFRCERENRPIVGDPVSDPCPKPTKCPGPHTVTDTGDGLLYADGHTVGEMVGRIGALIALPSEWRIE